MSLAQAQTSDNNGVLTSSSSPSPYSSDYQNQPTSSSSSGKISPAILFIIIIIAVIFFVSGLLHLLVRFLTKHQRSESRSDPETSSSNIQRQLQQLFHLHDSGLDQTFIDALPVFLYKEIRGPKEPFDCAVCLCEFAEQDRLRLLPLCSHAFHIDCIDTWLLSNSTCPLCRGALCSSDNQVFFFDEDLREDDSTFVSNVSSDEIRKRVFSVRLGKFRAQDVGDESQRRGETSSTTSSCLDSRRCFSMGSYQYVVADSDLQVALRPKDAINGGSNSMRLFKGRSDGDCEMKKIGSKGESFSVSKIWQWSRKGKCPSSSEDSSVTVQGLPWTDRSQAL